MEKLPYLQDLLHNFSKSIEKNATQMLTQITEETVKNFKKS